METIEAFQESRKQNMEKDLGTTSIRNENIVGNISSDEKLLQNLCDIIGNSTETLNKLEKTPQGIIEKHYKSNMIATGKKPTEKWM